MQNHSMKPRQYESIWLSDELLVAVDWSSGRFVIVEEILNLENVDYTVIYQSKYNSYVSYDYQPFCVEGFIANYYIKGKPADLEYLQHIIQKTLKETNKAKEKLNNCFNKSCYVDELHGAF